MVVVFESVAPPHAPWCRGVPALMLLLLLLPPLPPPCCRDRARNFRVRDCGCDHGRGVPALMLLLLLLLLLLPPPPPQQPSPLQPLLPPQQPSSLQPLPLPPPLAPLCPGSAGTAR